MSDVQTYVVEPLQAFTKDCAYLVKKCTKPDQKGMLYHILFTLYCLTIAKTGIDAVFYYYIIRVTTNKYWLNNK